MQLLEDRATTINSYCLIFNGYGGVGGMELEAENSSLSNAKVKNKWRCPSVPPQLSYQISFYSMSNIVRKAAVLLFTIATSLQDAILELWILGFV
jgi:hypothetical protein